jgi:hypothetical protein
MPNSSDPSNAEPRLPPTLPITVAYGGGKGRDNAPPASPPIPSPVILPDQIISPDGAVLPQADHAESLDQQAVPLRGLSQALTGEWLLELLCKSAWLDFAPGFQLCGPALSPAQAYMLGRLGRLEHYNPLQGPTRLRAIAEFPTLPLLPASIHQLAARLREDATIAGARIAILPQHETEHFALANRASLTAWARAKRFTLLTPETMNFEDLASMMAKAELVMIADSRQTGLLALSSPGANIIEIAPSGWRRRTGKSLCAALGQNWLPCDAGPPSYKLLSPLPFGARVPLSYEVAISDLARLLQTL